MIKTRHYTVAISIMVALVLQIMPMPIQVEVYRPDWVLVVLAYWCMALPHRVNVGVAFIAGIMMDTLLGTTLGTHALAYILPVFVMAANYQRLRNYSVWQQAIIIGLLSALHHLLLFWLQHLLNEVYFRFDYLWAVATSMLLWPWVFWLLRKVRRQLRIN